MSVAYDAIAKIIEAAADAGAEAPSNDVIAYAIGRSAHSVGGTIRRMKQAGLLSAETAGAARKFTINGKKTLWSMGYVPNREKKPVQNRRALESKQRKEAILAMISAAADAGVAAPSCVEMARRLSVTDVVTSRMIRTLKDAGAIKIEGRREGRRFTVVATGKHTAWSGAGESSSSGRLLALLTKFADEGLPLPSVDSIRKTLRLKQRDVDKAMRSLVQSGCIKMDTFAMQRRCIITSTGNATAFSNPGAQGSADQQLRGPALAILSGPRSGAKDWPAWRTCQWLEGDAKERNFCGEPTQAGSSYCPEHHSVCYTGMVASSGEPVWAERKKISNRYARDEDVKVESEMTWGVEA